MSGGADGGDAGYPGDLDDAHNTGGPGSPHAPAGPGDPAGHGRPERGEGGGRPRRGIRRRMVTGVAVVTAVAAVAVAVPVGLLGLGREHVDGPGLSPPGSQVRLAAQLTRFDACPAFLSYVRGHALEQLDAHASGEPTVPPGVAEEEAPAAPGAAGGGRSDAAAGGPAAAPAPAPPAGSAAGTGAFSGTNVQVADIDEPDTVKTDGRLLVSLEGDRLRIVDVGAATPQLRGVLAFAEPAHEMLLVGDKAVVFGARQPVYGIPRVVPTPAIPPLRTDPAPIPEDAPEDAHVPGAAVPGADAPGADAPGADAPGADAPGDGLAPPVGGGSVLPAPPAGETTVTVVDLADPDRPRVVRTFRLTGTQVAARVVAGEIRLVLRTEPPVPGPAVLPSAPGAPGAAEAWRMLIERSTADDWLPGYRVEGDGAPARRV